MTDAERTQVRPLLPVPGWLRGRGGQPEAYCHRAMLDAIRYVVDNGIKWRAVPADFPPWNRVYAFFRRWRDLGLVREFHAGSPLTAPTWSWPCSVSSAGTSTSPTRERAMAHCF
ncbi:transposase [Streptomyces avermitilis]|uniref:transposase n=1 Tax=Streptomyces avermitilis TaxID=33903 RepID=UPI0033E1A969